MAIKRNCVIQFSVPEYQGLGYSFIDVINNYLPSEAYKLQFLSGKILDIFYEEFIKFIPPYILKREEEKRKKAEEEQKAPPKVTKAIEMNRKLDGPSVQGVQQKMKHRKSTIKDVHNISINRSSMLQSYQKKRLEKLE